jgi:hypothetical protein
MYGWPAGLSCAQSERVQKRLAISARVIPASDIQYAFDLFGILISRYG